MYSWMRRELLAGKGYYEIMKMFQEELAGEAMSIVHGNKQKAARLMKIHRNSVDRIVKGKNTGNRIVTKQYV